MLMFLLLLFGLSESLVIQENVVFRRLHEVQTTKSRWLLTFVLDLKPYENFLGKISNDIEQAKRVAYQVFQKYVPPEKQGFLDALKGLKGELEVIKDTHKGLVNNFFNYKSITTRSKRAIFDFVGKISSVLFGTLSKSDLKSIKRNVDTLARNQDQISHVLEENMSILNLSRVQISENRNAINNLTNKLHEIDVKLGKIVSDLEKQVLELSHFVKIYLQLDQIVGSLRQTLLQALFYLEHFQSELNMLSLNRLSPSTVSPLQFQILLSDLKRKLPVSLKLPENPQKNLWYFYKVVTCDTIIDGSNILTIISIPLVDKDSSYELFRSYNLNVPIQAIFPNYKGHNLMAKYQLEFDYFAINPQRTKYIPVSQMEVEQCQLGNCPLSSPVLPVNLSKYCTIALFRGHKVNIKKYCQAVVSSVSVLPMGTYLFRGYWTIASDKELTFTLVCGKSDPNQSNIVAHPPLQVIQLPETCSGINYLQLLPFYEQESEITFRDPFSELIKLNNVSNIHLWDEFTNTLPSYNLTVLPKELHDVKQIPMGHLISKLQTLQPLRSGGERKFPLNWLLLGLVLFGLTVGISLVIYIKVYRHRLAMICSKKGKTKQIMHDIELSELKMAASKCVASANHASEDVETSAPRTAPGNAGQRIDILRKMYPTLELEAEG